MPITPTARPGFIRDERVADPLYDPIYHANRTLIGFVQGLFKALPEGKYTWSEDPELTEILITDAAPITLEVLTARPCIVAVRGAVQYANTAMNSLEYVDHQTGIRSFRDVVAGSITKNGVEAARLAWFVASHIKALRHLLQRKGPFIHIGQDVSVMGEMQPGGLVQDPSDSGAVNVPVILQFTVAHRWEVLSPALIAQDITAKINTKQP
jgi:hypothetical protein